VAANTYQAANLTFCIRPYAGIEETITILSFALLLSHKADARFTDRPTEDGRLSRPIGTWTTIFFQAARRPSPLLTN